MFTVCNQFSRGVFAMLGAVSPDSFDTLHSYSNTFQMPFVTPWFPEKVSRAFKPHLFICQTLLSPGVLSEFAELMKKATLKIRIRHNKPAGTRGGDSKSLNPDIKMYPCLIQFQVLTPSSGFLDFAISMRPDYHQAIIDTIRFYGWDKITYLYDSHDGE